MSASARLRELEAFVNANLLIAVPEDSQSVILLRALPEIVAVVEAAEGFFPEHLAVLQSDLPRALTALEEKLKQ